MIGIDDIQAMAGLIHILLGGPLEAMLILRHQITSISEATSLFTLGLIAASSYTSSSAEDYTPQNDATPIMHVISAWIISNLMHPKAQRKLTTTTPKRFHKKKQKFWR